MWVSIGFLDTLVTQLQGNPQCGDNIGSNMEYYWISIRICEMPSILDKNYWFYFMGLVLKKNSLSSGTIKVLTLQSLKLLFFLWFIWPSIFQINISLLLPLPFSFQNIQISYWTAWASILLPAPQQWILVKQLATLYCIQEE